MCYEDINTSRKYQLIICAVLFGCDESFVGLDLRKGLTVIRKSLHPKDQLNEIFELDAIGLRREYENARLDQETLDVACIYNKYEYTGDNNSAELYYERMSSELFTYLDNQIRAIRLLLEGPIRFKKLAIKMTSEHYIVDKTDMLYERNAIIPIGEAYNVTTIKKAHCDSIKRLRNEMDKITFPICQNYINQVHMLYDRSYLVTLQEAEVLLITSLEALFLDSITGKKECLSKRCATFLYESQCERMHVYKKLCDEYRKRSKYVHNADDKVISESDILFLRECVRKSILKLLDSPKCKKELITDLKDEISHLDYWTFPKR